LFLQSAHLHEFSTQQIVSIPTSAEIHSYVPHTGHSKLRRLFNNAVVFPGDASGSIVNSKFGNQVATSWTISRLMPRTHQADEPEELDEVFDVDMDEDEEEEDLQGIDKMNTDTSEHDVRVSDFLENMAKRLTNIPLVLSSSMRRPKSRRYEVNDTDSIMRLLDSKDIGKKTTEFTLVGTLERVDETSAILTVVYDDSITYRFKIGEMDESWDIRDKQSLYKITIVGSGGYRLHGVKVRSENAA
jgi:hypothetical protein